MFWIRPSTDCTVLSLGQIRCHLTALSPYSISPWQLSQDHIFPLLYCLLCVFSSFSFCFLLLVLPCATASAPVLPWKGSSWSRSDSHPAMKWETWSGHAAMLAWTERTRLQLSTRSLADTGREPHTNFVHVLGWACIKTYLLPEVCVMNLG